MTAAFRRHQQHVRIRRDRGITQRWKRDEGIVFGVNNQSRYPYAANEWQRAGFRIIVAGVSKAESRRDKTIVELFDGANAVQARRIVKMGEQSLFGSNATLERKQEIVSVNPVTRLISQIATGAQIR